MVSSQLQTEMRTCLYFKKYKYRAKLTIPGICYSYYTSNLEQFVRKLEGINQNRSKFQIAYINTRWEQIKDNIDLDQISRYFDWRVENKDKDYTIRIQGNLISFFSHDLALLESLKILDQDIVLTEANVDKTDVIYFKKSPKYKFRTYFKGKKAPDGFSQDIIGFMESYGKISKICPALRRFVSDTRYYNYLHSSYYVDYNDESTLTLLHLHFGSMLAKTYRLEIEP